MPVQNRYWIISGSALVIIAGMIAAYLSARNGSGSGAILNFPEPLLIEARGRDRGWQFTYAGTDGILGSNDDLVTREHLRVPAGLEVLIRLRSDDYIYVFSCPDLTLKEIAVPDLDYEIRFRRREPGSYELAMDPMCGFRLRPGENMGTLQITPEDEFHAWFAKSAVGAYE